MAETEDPGLVGRVVDLAGLVDYQQGSVVSREVIRRGSGTGNEDLVSDQVSINQ